MVILISSLMISAVLVLTIAGSSLYISWKEGDAARSHSLEMAKLNAQLYGRHIKIFDLAAKIGRDSIYKNKYLIEGTIKNTGFRTISSVTIEVDFLNAARKTIQTEEFKPLGSSLPPSKLSMATLSIFTSGKELPLAPGKNLRFKHILSRQKDKNVVSPIKHKRYATNPNEWSGKLNHSVSMIKF